MKLTLEKLLELLPGFRVDHRGKNITGSCPECGHNEFGVSLDEGHRFGCYRKNKCGFNGNIFTLLRYLGKMDEVLQEKVKELPKKIITYPPFEDFEDLHLENITPPLGWKRVFDNPYLNERGFTQLDYNRYPVGITNLDPRLKKNYIVFLCEQRNNIKGWVSRRTQNKKQIDTINATRKAQGLKPVARYINSFSDFAKMCYGIDEIDDQVKVLIIVEGIFDKINIDRLLNLHNRSDVKCIATYKAAISKEQIGLIMKNGPNIETSILLYDSDVIKSIKNSMNILQKYYNVLVGYHSTKDPGDMNNEDLDSVLSTLQSPIEFKSFKLEVNKL